MSYFIEFTVIAAVLGTFVALIIAPFAMLALAIVLIAVAAAALALVAGIVAAPFLAVRAVRRRLSEHRHERVEEPAYAVHATVGTAS